MVSMRDKKTIIKYSFLFRAMVQLVLFFKIGSVQLHKKSG